MILSHLRTAVLAAFPGLDAPKKAFFRVVRSVGLRLNVQPVNATLDQTRDLSNIEVWPGVPGVSSDPKEGEQVVISFVGKDQTPIVTHRGPPTAPASTEFGVAPTCPLPLEVRHDVAVSLRMLSRSEPATKMYVGGNGSPTYPVALAPPVDSIKTALTTFAAALALGPPGPTPLQVEAAAAALQTALGLIPSAAAAKLESR